MRFLIFIHHFSMISSMIVARIVPFRPIPTSLLLGEMNSDNERGAVGVIHNTIDVASNEEMFWPGLSVAPERNQIVISY